MFVDLRLRYVQTYLDLYVKRILLCGFDLKYFMNFSLSNLMEVRSVIFELFLRTDGRTTCAPQRYERLLEREKRLWQIMNDLICILI